MRQRYGCVCFAVPKKLLTQLADDDEDEEHGKLLRSHVDHSSQLRAQRAVQSQERPEREAGQETAGPPGLRCRGPYLPARQAPAR